MRRVLILLLSIFLGQSVLAFTPQSRQEYCEKSRDPLFFQKLLEQNSQSRMSFRNSGGLFNQGVCWWHSLFQRNALHLTYYSPQKARPTSFEAARIIRKIRLGKSVIEIPGFENFYEFSKFYIKLIQHELNYWQIHDGVLLSKWFPALTKPYQLSPEKLKMKMDQLYHLVKEGRVVFQMLQLKGIVAHGWLVTDMQKSDNGYQLSIIESNNPSENIQFFYTEGDTYLIYDFKHDQSYRFVPYTDYEDNLNLTYKTINDFCKKDAI